MKKTLLICTIILALCGCKSNKADEPDKSYMTLVTYAGTDEALQVSTFTYQAIDDSPLVTLTANWVAGEELTPGERVYLTYYADAYQVSGPVTIRNISPVIGWIPSESEGPIDLGNAKITPVTVWRSGPYLNARINAWITRDPVTVKFALDKLTAADPMPTYYLSVNQTNINQIEAYNRSATISYDIADVWNAATCKGVRIVYRDFDGNEAALTLEKQQKD